MEILYFLVTVVLVLLVNYLIAREYQRIATQKGFPGWRYFWWCFLMGIVGYIMVAALPDRNRYGGAKVERS